MHLQDDAALTPLRRRGKPSPQMEMVPLELAPRAVLARLASEPGAVLLEVPDPERPVTLLGCRPVAELRLTLGDANPLDAIERFVRAAPVPALPFPLGGGVIGLLTYELGRVTAAPRASRPLPPSTLVAVLRRYDPLLVFDHTARSFALMGSPGVHPEWLTRLRTPGRPARRGPLASGPLVAGRSRAEHVAAVQRIHEYLLAGDTYQVNLTQPFTTRLMGSARELADRLAARHPEPYTAYLDLGEQQIVANSPELFLRRRGQHVETRPIKGTRPRGADAATDATRAAELTRDAKEQAEHVMIVDLERNDLGRVCTYGSVHVDGFARIETHPTVHHLVSTVRGTLRDDVGLATLLAATFPGGSITGAPKRRAMEIIDELEPWPRGAYCGALGLFDPRGDLELALPIRTAVIEGDRLRYHAGGGIVLDSDPERELAEAWLKTAGLRLALEEDIPQCSSG